MNTTEFEFRALDIASFASLGGHMQGRWPLSSLSRLSDLFHAAARPLGGVDWRADGERRVLDSYGPQACVHLRLNTRLTLTCQRCLEPIEVPMQIDRWIYFIDGEDQAAQLDADSEDDVLALSRSLDLLPLAEDELLLALPPVPRHETCPNPLMLVAEDPSFQAHTQPNPFSALAALKRAGR